MAEALKAVSKTPKELRLENFEKITKYGEAQDPKCDQWSLYRVEESEDEEIEGEVEGVEDEGAEDEVEEVEDEEVEEEIEDEGNKVGDEDIGPAGAAPVEVMLVARRPKRAISEDTPSEASTTKRTKGGFIFQLEQAKARSADNSNLIEALQRVEVLESRLGEKLKEVKAVVEELKEVKTDIPIKFKKLQGLLNRLHNTA
ncbi:hypothetical protein VC83_06530 [Pseudogymnoascus destructans]|uniref:Uncharacterized protein n=1 Tax=Pseudogymnoascus destructans TaxID=655981 RepID=A0A177A843_9PEZI|nr:uncharacterized protein VC83_06530 [Pseudogymnoascus destructans]OAF58316.1 hypothetical protein VC83_06530 [Pseudogymnoascus destructans]